MIMQYSLWDILRSLLIQKFSFLHSHWFIDNMNQTGSGIKAYNRLIKDSSHVCFGDEKVESWQVNTKNLIDET